VIVGGFLSNIELLFYPLTLLCVSGGMRIGEIVSYHLGKTYGLHFLQKYGKYILISNTVLENIQTMVHKNWRWGMILSEFHGWTRGLFPFIAGVSKVPF
jgi:membrane protein DedA with SNARE-associated domain